MNQISEFSRSSSPAKWKKTIGIAVAIAIPTVTVAGIVVPALLDNGMESSAETLILESSESPASTGAQDSSADQLTMQESRTDQEQGQEDSIAKSEHVADPSVPVWGGLREFDEGDYNWAMPVDIRFDSFPEWDGSMGDYGMVCGEEQVRWLNERGPVVAVMRTSYEVEVRNEADQGGAVSLADIRFEGELNEHAGRVEFLCPSPPIGGEIGQIVEFEIDGSAAVFGEQFEPEFDRPKGTPFTLNVSPGATESMSLYRGVDASPTVDARGRFLATFATGGEGDVYLSSDLNVLAPVIHGYRIEYHPLGDSDLRSSESDWKCFKPGFEEPKKCSLDDIHDLMLEAAGEADAQGAATSPSSSGRNRNVPLDAFPGAGGAIPSDATRVTSVQVGESAYEPTEIATIITPSGNIGCDFVMDDSREVSMGCGVLSYMEDAPYGEDAIGPRWWIDVGISRDLVINSRGEAPFFLIGEASAEVVDYGNVVVYGEFVCGSASDGLTCWNSVSGHGIFVNRTGVETF